MLASSIPSVSRLERSSIVNCQLIIFSQVFLLCAAAMSGQEPVHSQTVVAGPATTVRISDLERQADVSPMIYGQMLEDCNDHIIYGGIVNEEGKENPSVTARLEKMQIPVVRWPAGTAIYDYEWKRGVGPVRTAQSEKIWGGHEYYTFGTDEYLNWCRKIGTEPYINIPMGNNSAYAHSLGEALDWVEYVNGAPDSPMGACRARNGNEAPYGVKFWCLGNENYLGNPFHRSEKAADYAELLYAYASALKHVFPGISLLGVGHTGDWNKTVLNRCGEQIDFLTLHFYLTANVNAKVLENPVATLFAPEKVEANIRHFCKELNAYNQSAHRTARPVRFSIDEWNCRHSVYDGGAYSFTRRDPRRLYDAAAMASMLNVFIRTSPYVGMANYIFPVNGHGLLQTVGEQDVYPSVCYHVYDLYRRLMLGKAVGTDVAGPGYKDVNLSDLKVDGDVDAALRDVRKDFCFIDCAAMLDKEGRLIVSLVNRSYENRQKVRLSVPSGYEVAEAWTIGHRDVCAENTAEERDNVTPSPQKVRNKALTLNPCAVTLVVLHPSNRIFAQ
ncbi:MAG: hypothetical protein IJR87_01525 [Bacteroidaceae bacterium]|nr:hypothetical protein [Bacteroidaceae bacterium]